MNRTDTTLRLNRAQYRQYAEQTKAAGKGLNLVTFTDTQNWGEWGMWALAMVDDAAAPPTFYCEKGLISLASTINTKRFRHAGISRPECDWSQLTDAEIYPFIVMHEIGHTKDNFSVWDLMRCDQKDPKVQQAHAVLACINEVLADRYAWERICNRPMPLTEQGRRDADKYEACIELLTQQTGRRIQQSKPLPAGQYRSVPEYMLATPDRAKWIGPDVHPDTLRRSVEAHAQHEERHGYPMWRQLTETQMHLWRQRHERKQMEAQRHD
ncbi:hypothetical protein EHF36_07930 [Kerstersia gyiorum]|uniref:hypothetical protein n=1 Tax=Kerstersia gyiorum TaxID=206506 RepID=UPI00107075F8|nr:hypothetical protein [Kerstersia gyiorum]QBR40563.1 hypothetical protein EHF36_07930 [Kerstersia gyiorum]